MTLLSFGDSLLCCAVDAPAGSQAGKTAEISTSESVYYSADEGLAERQSINRRQSVTYPLQAPNPINVVGERDLRSLFCQLTKAHYALCTYDHDTAEQLLLSLSGSAHWETAWTKCKLGRLYMQSVNYEAAKASFMEARLLDPTHIEDMDIFSSLLFVMNNRNELSNLERELRGTHKYIRVIQARL